ncbi:MAG: DUF4198 domain-containing protein [Planctomycetota bacterium]
MSCGLVIAFVLTLLSVGGRPASAHDFWIEPSSFDVEEGRGVVLALRVGDHFRGDPVPRKAAHQAAFRWTGPGGSSVDVNGIEGRDPAGLVGSLAAGTSIASYVSTPQRSVLLGPTFQAYLLEEGFRHALDARRGHEDEPGVESYTRCAKALVRTADANGLVDRRLGLPLELVASGPALAGADASDLGILVLRDGKPAEGVRVVARRRGYENDVHEATTNADGKARLPLPEGEAIWLVRAVVLEQEGAEVTRWRSHWASLIFERRPPRRPVAGSGD